MSEQIRALNSILIDVFDRERSLAFYRDVLGLAVVGEIDDGHVTVFGLGDGLALVMHAATQEEVGHAPVHAGHTLFFQVDDPDGWARRLNDAGLKATGPTDEPWGTVVMTEDPDGRAIGLIRPPS